MLGYRDHTASRAGAIVPRWMVKRRDATNVGVVHTRVERGMVEHKWWPARHLRGTIEGVHWVIGWHDKNCEMVQAMAAAQALLR